MAKLDHPSDVRPSATLVVGVTGHRKIALDSDATNHIALSIHNFLSGMRDGLDRICEKSAFLSATNPALRLVSMAAEGADLIGMRCAHRLQIPIMSVLPFYQEEYRKDFSRLEYLNLLEAILDASISKLELPGTRDEGPRSYERANNVIISNCDVLIAIWDGLPASGVAGTGDVVQLAFERGIPVLVIDPAKPDGNWLLSKSIADRESRAMDAVRKTIPNELGNILETILSPPSIFVSNRAVKNLFDRKKSYWRLRYEYSALLKIFGPGHSKIGHLSFDDESAWKRATETAVLCDPNWAWKLDVVSGLARQFDELASHFGALYRSSTTSGFFLAIVVSLFSGVVGVLFPSYSAITLSVQAVVGALIFVDRWINSNQRWQERWLTYRCIAERLKTLRFLQVFGLCSQFDTSRLQSTGPNTTDWFVRRTSRSLGLADGRISSETIASAFEQLADYEVKSQIIYHKIAYRRFGYMDRRLSVSAGIALLGIVAMAIAPKFSPYAGPGVDNSVRAISGVMLAMLPAALAAFNGIRADADLIRLTERSAWAAAFLSKLKRTIATTDHTYDHYEGLAQQAASFMAAELNEWQTVLESRRLRLSRRKAFRKGVITRRLNGLSIAK
jgi:hypothetical protein